MKQTIKRTTAAILAALILAGAGTSVAVFSGVGSTVVEAETSGTVHAVGTPEEFTQAVQTASAGDTIQLTADIDLTDAGVLDVSDLTIDLGGNTISADNFSLIFEGSNFTIRNGNLSANGGSYALFVGDEGTTDNVLIESVTMDGGINVYNSTNVTLRDVNITGTGYYAVWCDENGHVKIESGEFQSTGVAVVGLASFLYEGEEVTPASLEIQGGNFQSNDKPMVLEGERFTPTISGGSYDADVKDYLAEGVVYVSTGPDGGETYSVGPTAVEVVQNASADDEVTVLSGSLVADDVPQGVVIKTEENASATINGVELTEDNMTDDGYVVPEKPTVTPPPTVVTYTVTFQTNGGTQVAAQGVTSGTALTVPAAPTKEGYTFAGWYTDEALTQAYDFTQPVTGNLALYAKWTEDVTVDQVQSVKAVKKATTWLKLNFNQVNGADGYEIYNAETGEKLADCTTQNGRAVLTKTVTGLEKGTTYKLQVRAYKLVDGERVYGEASPIYTKATACLDKVTGVRPIKKTQTTLKIQFNQVEGAQRYKIFDAETGEMLCTVSTQNGADVLKKTITGLKAGETRQYKVRAYATINGKSEYGEFSNTLVKATAD